MSFDPQQIQDMLMIVVAAATPLLIAAIGEVVAERAGVLNLGLEGMMIVGASTGFAFAYLTDSTIIGILAGVICGMLMSAVFAFLTIGLATNQVAAGLALTIFGRGLANLIGEGFVGLKRTGAPHLYIPGLTDLPLVGRLLFGQDFFVYFAVLLTGAVAYWLMRTRGGLTLRAVGDNHTSGHSLGVPVRGIRLLAVLFGGGCAGLAGCYLSLSYTPFWSPDMTAGRGWIAVAAVILMEEFLSSTASAGASAAATMSARRPPAASTPTEATMSRRVIPEGLVWFILFCQIFELL